jgi:hypothetical protein
MLSATSEDSVYDWPTPQRPRPAEKYSSRSKITTKKKSPRPIKPLLSHQVLDKSGRFINTMAAAQVAAVPLPTLPEGWSAEKGYKVVGGLSSAIQRNVEPVGPHFLAHARRVNI